MPFSKSFVFLALASTTLALPQGVEERDAPSCTALPTGAGPIPTPDTAEAFLTSDSFSQAAISANTPDGYVNTFTNLQASTIAQGYLTYYTLNSYDADQCAAKCHDTADCTSFNIFFQHAPSTDPGPNCPNPPSTTLIKCSLFSNPITPDKAKNAGQYRQDFHVVIAGSNGYARDAVPEIDGFDGTRLRNGAIEALADCTGTQTYMGYTQFDISGATPYNVSRCAAACREATAYNVAHPRADGSETPACNFFNSYVLSRNGVAEGQVCGLYTRAWPARFATNVGQYRGSDKYTISLSYAYKSVGGSFDACLPGQ